MHYSVHHVTRFRYSAPIRESLVETRLRPQADELQRLNGFHLTTHPRAQLFTYADDFGNTVYHFDIPGEHQELTIDASSKVDVDRPPTLPEALAPDAWEALRSDATKAQHFELLCPSTIAKDGEALEAFLKETGLEPHACPLATVRDLNETLYRSFTYESGTTRVDSPIEVAIASRKGVCQDFAHVMIAILRDWGIPARYVSGYVCHRPDAILDRSAPDQSHAWVEAFLPGIGWVGFDPTNDCLAEERHIRIAYGRDYADAPPTRGVFKGDAQSELAVAVTVTPSEAPRLATPFLRVLSAAKVAEAASPVTARLRSQSAQQQQQ
ncbi:MAG: transglutaminase family protein [Alphaproteobacteria bacterium]|nr:transglutaminase family protein [Alphaproteobacteria bacterium]